jgi:hypothetical protein
MTGALKARQPHRRAFGVSASIPVLSIDRAIGAMEFSSFCFWF